MMENFIKQYYLDPISYHTGYNLVNTLTYGVIAILGIYIIYRLLKKKMDFDKNFFLAVFSFILFGATVRVVTYSIDSGVFKAVSPIHKLVLESGIYNYGFWTVSPGIYIVTFALFLFSLLLLIKLGKQELHMYVGFVLWLPHFLLLLSFMKYAIYALPVILLAALPALLAYQYFKNAQFAAVVAGHAFDGAATFFAIEHFSTITGVQYFEQHVVSGAIGSSSSYFTFYLIKVVISFAACYLIIKEKMQDNERNFIAAALMVMGFGPGIRDVLRMVIGA